MNTATADVSSSSIAQTGPAAIPAAIGYGELLRRAKLEDQRQIEQARFEAQRQQVEASSARVAQVTVLKGRIDELCEQWQENRAALRETFAQIYEAEEALGTVTGGQVHHMPRGLLKAHIPSAKPGPMDAVWGSGFSSSEEDLQAWLASGRKVWPTR